MATRVVAHTKQELRNKAHKVDVAFSQERSILVKKVLELQVS